MSTQSRVTQISGVTIKSTAKGDLYVVTAGGTEYSTFTRALAEQARQLEGQNVQLHYIEKVVNKDGRTFTNLYYEGAEATNGTLPTLGNQSSGMGQLSFPTAPPVDKDREGKIMRQTATKVAAHLMPYLPEAERTPTGLLAMADYLVLYYEHGSGANQGPTQPLQDPGTQLPAFTSDDDIPF